MEGDKLVVRTFNKGVSDTTTNTEEVLMAKFGLKPSQLVDYKALVGDSSDNIKGVPGVGPKTAVGIIKKFGTIENLYAHLSDDKKLEARFGPFWKEAELSKKLVILERNVPLEMPQLQELAPPQEQDAIIEYFIKTGFETLLKRLMGVESQPAKRKKWRFHRKMESPKVCKGACSKGADLPEELDMCAERHAPDGSASRIDVHPFSSL